MCNASGVISPQRTHITKENAAVRPSDQLTIFQFNIRFPSCCDCDGSVSMICLALQSSTINLPRNIPIWQVNSNSPDSLGTNSTEIVSPVGRLALLLKSGNRTISEQAAVSSRRKFSLTGVPLRTSITSGVYPPFTRINASWYPDDVICASEPYDLFNQKNQKMKAINSKPITVTKTRSGLMS